jgi:hypothetical protein
MIGTSTRLPPAQRLVEIKAVADLFYFKISTLLLHGGKVVEAITWFRKHIRSFERVVGSPEVAFLHWEWFSRQFLVFGELMETTSSTVPDTLSPRFGTADNALTEWEFQPAYYYQVQSKSFLRSTATERYIFLLDHTCYLFIIHSLLAVSSKLLEREEVCFRVPFVKGKPYR